MNQIGQDATAYDRVPYLTHCFPQTHPDRLALHARFYGMKPAPLHHCHVLEVGCGTGENLIPMAHQFPESFFWGIDAAKLPIEQGRRMSEELGLPNLRLDSVNLLDFSTEEEKFDFIIVHGVFSWVSEANRSGILSICRDYLSPQGVAFISYNAYPGWYLHMAVRDIMRFHVRALVDPDQRIHQAKSVLQFLLKANPERDYYHAFLKKDMADMITADTYHLYHDELAEENTPFYFLNFMEAASAHNLQYLAEAHFSDMQDFIYPDPVAAMLRQIDTKSRLLKEQYLDYIKCRRFRHTLLCHAGTVLKPKPDAELVEELWVSARLESRPADFSLKDPEVVYFDGPDGSIMATDTSIGKAAFLELCSVHPAALQFEDLYSRARGRVIAENPALTDVDKEDRKNLRDLLLGGYHAGALEFYLDPLPIISKVSECPQVSGLARYQARHRNWVTSARHKTVKLEDELWQGLIPLLDGTKDRRDLAELLFSEKTQATIRSEEWDKMLEEKLQATAQAGLLIG
jgi:methyltransferase-like protein/2-polyprenyl-3-methyl-5-hydroxy-6-metoxy-1,4-benzoquinol methylase